MVNTDADSVTVLDPASRASLAEIALGPTPAVDDAGRYEPPVKPRALAILPNDQKVYVAAQTGNQGFVLEARTRAVLTSIPGIARSHSRTDVSCAGSESSRSIRSSVGVSPTS